MSKFLKLIKIKSYPAKKAVSMVSSARWVKEQFVKIIDEGTCEVYSKNILGKNIGIIFLFTNLEDKELADGENICYLANLFVHPKLRGKGIGTEIMEYMFQIAKERNFKQITLGVEEKIEKNVRLYKKLGFTTELKKSSVDAVLKDKNGNPIPAKEHIILVKNL